MTPFGRLKNWDLQWERTLLRSHSLEVIEVELNQQLLLTSQAFFPLFLEHPYSLPPVESLYVLEGNIFLHPKHICDIILYFIFFVCQLLWNDPLPRVLPFSWIEDCAKSLFPALPCSWAAEFHSKLCIAAHSTFTFISLFLSMAHFPLLFIKSMNTESSSIYSFITNSLQDFSELLLPCF